jgi:phage minor structural protein
VINAPKKRHDQKNIDISFTCDHISSGLKTKNLFLTFDDENGINTIQNLAKLILAGTGWSLGECDTFFESDGKTEKVRSLISDGKLGSYQLIQNLCDLFCGYPEFDGDKKLVHLRCLNRRNAQMELSIGKNLSSIEQTPDTKNIITRLYVEGEYTEDGYVGIDDVNPTGLSFL